jgi:hypothetical protein
MLLPRSSRWIPVCYSLFFILLISAPLIAPAYSQTRPQGLPAPAPKGVLLLYTYGDGLPAYQKATPAFLSVMTAGGMNINDLFLEYLDLQRNNNVEYRQKLADLLRYKYARGARTSRIGRQAEISFRSAFDRTGTGEKENRG